MICLDTGKLENQIYYLLLVFIVSYNFVLSIYLFKGQTFQLKIVVNWFIFHWTTFVEF